VERFVPSDLKANHNLSAAHPSLKSEITQIVRGNGSIGSNILCSGYSDGTVRMFQTGSEGSVTFQGHQSSILSLALSPNSLLLASASQDTHIVIWDLVSQTGVCRFSGHKNGVSCVKFVSNDVLVSGSQDTLIKVWDIPSKRCSQTLVGHRSEIWTLDILGDRMVTGSSDDQIRMFSIYNNEKEDEEEEEEHDEMSLIKEMGSVQRESHNRDKCNQINMISIQDIRFVGVLSSSSKLLSIFKFRSESEKEKKRKKRIRKLKKRKLEELSSPEDILPLSEEGTVRTLDIVNDSVKASDELELIALIRLNQKANSFSFDPTFHKDASLRVLVSLMNNKVDVYSLPLNSPQDLTIHSSFEQQGHRSSIRAVALSKVDGSDFLATVDDSEVKVWNFEKGRCVATISLPSHSNGGLCLSFLPKDRQIVVGTRNGSLVIVDVPTCSIAETVKGAHQGAIWALQLNQRGKVLATGGADKVVNFWDLIKSSKKRSYDEEEEEEEEKEEIKESSEVFIYDGWSLDKSRILRMNEEVLSLRYSHSDSERKLLLAVGTLDNTIKVFYDDSLKLFRSLYGHKLPILSIDISDDNTLLVSSSADKTIKIWGLDFGDCHKSILAHDDNVMCVKFAPQSHYIFSCSKDGSVKYWDGDAFDQILDLRGHLGEVWGIDVSSTGGIVASCGGDKSIRIWERTSDLVFLEEERRKFFEGKVEEEITHRGHITGYSDLVVVMDEEGEDASSSLPSTRSMVSVRSGERILEGLEVAMVEVEKFSKYTQAVEKIERWKGSNILSTLPDKPLPNPLLCNLPPHHYMLHIIKSIPAPALEQSLLVLPMREVEALMGFLVDLLEEKVREVEIVMRCALFLLRIHHSQIVTHRSMVGLMHRLSSLAPPITTGICDLIGVNMASLGLIKRRRKRRKEEKNMSIEIEENGGDILNKRSSLF